MAANVAVKVAAMGNVDVSRYGAVATTIGLRYFWSGSVGFLKMFSEFIRF